MDFSLRTTFGNGGWTDHFQQTACFKPDAGEENHVINIYPEVTYETLEGFGGAITESAAYVY